jgi:HSP20 family protein
MTTEVSTRPSNGISRLFERDPFRSLQHQMDDLIGNFSRDFDGGFWPGSVSKPLLDISETDTAIEVRVDLPGIKSEDVNVEVRNGVLQITGERKEEREEKGKTWHHIERRTGSFMRSLSLPCAVKEAKVEAAYSNGVLTITLPKAEEAKPHRVPVRAK